MDTTRGHNPHRQFGMASDFFATEITEITEITEKKGCYDGVRRAREKCQLWPCVVYIPVAWAYAEGGD